MGALIIDVKQPLLLVAPEGREEETITRLSRVGFDHALGFLKGGFSAWKMSGREYDSIQGIKAEELEEAIMKEGAVVFDVRKEGVSFGTHSRRDSHAIEHT